MTSPKRAAMIGVDWGTTSFRANLLSPEGKILDKIFSSEGILASHTSFEDTLEHAVSHWLEESPNIPILASGMITSHNGWIQTPYQQTPSSVSDFSNSLLRHKTKSNMAIYFIAGLSHENELGRPDIMRGEESQIIGAVAAELPLPSEKRVYLLPGTHSKWAETSGEQITGFTTFMPGEFYALAIKHSILGTLTKNTSTSISDGFMKGVKARMNSKHSILHLLFMSRTLAIFEKIQENEISDYISGLFICEEVLSAKRNGVIEQSKTVRIIGRNELVDRYTLALSEAWFAVKSVSEDIITKAHFAIAKSGGLLS